MSKTLVLVLYASSVNENANQVGPASRSLSLQQVLGDVRAKPPVPGPNDALFDVPGAGRAQLLLTGLNAAAIHGFKGGAKYKVTVHEIHEEPKVEVAPAVEPAPAAEPSTPPPTAS